MPIVEDMDVLTKSPLPEVRETIAETVSKYFNTNNFNISETDKSYDVIRMLARDPNISVRTKLSQSLKDNPKVPHDVILTLAHDKAQVALPILEHSRALTEGDLIEIIRSTNNITILNAITRRRYIHTTTSAALIHTYNPNIIQNLLANKKAQISDESLHAIIQEFHDNFDVLNSLVTRAQTTLNIAKKAVNSAPKALRNTLIKRYNLSKQHLNKDKTPPKKKQLTKHISTEKQIASTRSLAIKLEQQGNLTPSRIIQALCDGDITLFSMSIAIKSSLSLQIVNNIITRNEQEKLFALFDNAGLPKSIFNALQYVLNYINKKNLIKQSPRIFKQQLLEHILHDDQRNKIPQISFIIALLSNKQLNVA